MSKPTFTWLPDIGSKRKMKPNVHQTKFGDGYELRIATNVNFKPASWSLTFTKNAEEFGEIADFLDEMGGVQSFDWTDPLGKSGTYVCREWETQQSKFGIYEVTATFEQVFEF